jgi:CAAX prenyl protease-like protein
MGAAARWAWIAGRMIGACIVIPVVEELAFRGFLLRWLVSTDFETLEGRAWTWPAILLSSLAFGAVHANWIAGTLAGALFAAARLWRGRLSDAILAHAVANTVIAAVVLALGRWYLWA